VALVDLQGGERAVGGDPLGLRLLDVAEERPGQLRGQLKYSFFMPHLPSTAEQCSMTSTGAPVSRSTSAERVPMFWALRWQGSR